MKEVGSRIRNFEVWLSLFFDHEQRIVIHDFDFLENCIIGFREIIKERIKDDNR